MANAIRFYETGAPEVMRWEEIAVGDPGPGEVLIRHVAVGLNYADTYFRTGLYPVPLPNGMGVEASGVIEAVGEGVTHVAAGDRVAYTGSPLGAYSTERVMPAAPLVKLPEALSCETAAAMMMRGLTASYLLRRIYPLEKGMTVLIHAAAGGLGLIFCQWAKLLGLTVIGTVSTGEKAALARAHGCDHVILYTREDVPKRVREITNGEGVSVVYDSVGQSTFAGSLDSLRKKGLLVCVGTSSGKIPPIDAMQLVIKGSLFVTRPALADYITPRSELESLSRELFGHVAAGRIKIEVNQKYSLQDAVHAHHDLEARKTTGHRSLWSREPGDLEMPNESAGAPSVVRAESLQSSPKVEPVAPALGAEVSNVSIANAVNDEDLFAEIRALLLKHRVLFFRDQDISPATHVAFARRFGDLEAHPVLPSHPDHPELLLVNRDTEHSYENTWHCDATWRANPPFGAVLRCVVCPEVGGDTMWANMVLAYERLPRHIKHRIESLRAKHSIEHSFGGRLTPEARAKLSAANPTVEHPVVRTHPETNEKVLFVNQGFTTHFVNFHNTEDVRYGQDFTIEANNLLNYLVRQAEIPEYQVRLRWKPNTIALWDNRATQHYAIHDFYPAVRKMMRATIVGDQPF